MILRDSTAAQAEASASSSVRSRFVSSSPVSSVEYPGSGWPADFYGLQPLWRGELGKGYPGPIVAADRVFVVETVDRKTVAVRALSRESGEELWDMFSESKTYVFVAGLEAMHTELDAVFSNLAGSDANWERRKAELQTGGRWIELVY